MSIISKTQPCCLNGHSKTEIEDNQKKIYLAVNMLKKKKNIMEVNQDNLPHHSVIKRTEVFTSFIEHRN